MREQNFDPQVAHAQNVGRTGGRSEGRPVDLRSDEPEEIVRDGQVFQRNLKFLLRHSGSTQAELAKRANVSHDWLRQLTKRGLTQIREKNREPLERLRRVFLLDSTDEFWSESLIKDVERVSRRSDQMRPYLRSKDWPYLLKVLELLQSGEHDYLRGLIKALADETKVEGVTEKGFHMPD